MTHGPGMGRKGSCRNGIAQGHALGVWGRWGQRGGPTWLSPQASLFLQITAQQIAAQGQAQKVTYATQPALKTQFLTTPISQAQKLAGTQQVQTQIQVSMGEPGAGLQRSAQSGWHMGSVQHSEHKTRWPPSTTASQRPVP